MFVSNLPIAIIGAGPVGLAAAGHALLRGLTPLVLESGSGAGHNALQWRHVRMFSPWRYNVDRVAGRMLAEIGWRSPDPDHFPTGRELVVDYLEPLAAHPALRPHIRLNTTVVAITRLNNDKMKDSGRDDAPFLLRTRTASGEEGSLLAKAVIDASGTYGNPNPLGTGGIPALGETALRDHITYGVPDVPGSERGRYAGKRVVVVGSGDSAFNALIALIALKDEDPSTEILWAVRRTVEEINFGGGQNDALPERGALGQRVRSIIEQGAVRLVPDFRVTRLERSGETILVHSDRDAVVSVDEIVAVTGYRPNLEMLREIRLSLDHAVESPSELAPLIDPNIHSCGTVRPHGEKELAHPETGFYIAGMKSYGRAPTFLMLTGYEQVRSIVAALDGDWQAARDVQLDLPETGVCSLNGSLAQEPVAVKAGASDCCPPSCCS
jgi:hypothetical protein